MKTVLLCTLMQCFLPSASAGKQPERAARKPLDAHCLVQFPLKYPSSLQNAGASGKTPLHALTQTATLTADPSSALQRLTSDLSAGVERFQLACAPTSGDSDGAAVVRGVQSAAGAVGGQRVLVLPQNSVDDVNQHFSVLLPQETVHERIGGGFGVGQTLGGHAPVPGDVHGGL